MTFLRWVLLIPAATAGGSLGLAIGILFAVIGKVFNDRLTGDEAFPAIMISSLATYGWYMAGMIVAPRIQNQERILFGLTMLLIFILGIQWSPIFFNFNIQDFLVGSYIKFIWVPLGVVGTTVVVWINGDAKSWTLKSRKNQDQDQDQEENVLK